MLESNFFLPGVKDNDLKKIIEEFGINNLEQLKKAVKSKKIRQLKGFNSKIEMAILRGIKIIQDKPEYLPIGIALDYGKTLINQLRTWPGISQVFLVGSLRRGVEEVNRIEILLAATMNYSIEQLVELPMITGGRIENRRVVLDSLLGLPIVLYFSDKNRWGLDLIKTTGSANHLQALKLQSNNLLHFDGEEEVYKQLGLPWIPPELRETGFEVQFAREGILPKLVDISDIKGDLHIHSRWSDGANTIEEIIQKGISIGYEYLAITDHSQSLKIAGGLSPADLSTQIKEIDRLKVKYPQIQILKGIEVDILEDGSLDFQDDILEKMDVVIGSIHSHFHMSKVEMTERIIKGLKHPLVNILAHPTGRVLGKRPGYSVDIEKVIQIAAHYKKILEINASPDRLDLRDKHLQFARTKGVRIAINTDAHSIDRMSDMAFGVQTAKRGWQTSQEIINSWSYEEIKAYFQKNRR
ncbi:MAG: PHP domain-containing protein [Bacillota bacterium]